MSKFNSGRPIAVAALVAAPLLAGSILIAQSQPLPAPPPIMAPVLVPNLTVDLMTAEGMGQFGAQWKIMEARLVEAPLLPNTMPGYDKSFEISPKAGEKGFDDSKWSVIEPKGLGDRRGGGRVSFIWYRTNLTMPAKVGNFDTKDATAVFTAYIDDYAEVWINGAMPRRAGRPSPATIQGFNIPNHVVLSEKIAPGDKFELAVFGINGPISVAPPNFIFWREAKLSFYR
jgi:gluconolactonase